MNRVREDIAFVLARRMDNGADFWATPQGSLVKGGPFSTLEAVSGRSAILDNALA